MGAYPKTAEDPHGVGPLRKWGAKTMERRTQIARMADGIMHMSLKEADQLVDRFLHLLRRPGQPGVLAVTVYATKLNLQNFSLRLQHSLVRPAACLSRASVLRGPRHTRRQRRNRSNADFFPRRRELRWRAGMMVDALRRRRRRRGRAVTRQRERRRWPKERRRRKQL